MYIVHRTSYIIHCTLYNVHSTSYIVRRTSYVFHRTSYMVHYTFYIVHHTLYNVHCISYIVRRIRNRHGSTRVRRTRTLYVGEYTYRLTIAVNITVRHTPLSIYIYLSLYLAISPFTRHTRPNHQHANYR